MNKLITASNLSEELLDTLNAMNALITTLAKRAQMSDRDVQTIRFQSSAAHKRLAAKIAQDQANRQAYEEDKQAMAAWALDARYMYANATEWAKAAAIEWQCIVERAGSEHGRAHGLVYREPSQAELLKALDEYGKWVNATAPKSAGHRARALRVLPHIKKKLAALLVA